MKGQLYHNMYTPEDHLKQKFMDIYIYILISNQHFNSINDVQSYGGLDINSDHYFIVMKLSRNKNEGWKKKSAYMGP